MRIVCISDTHQTHDILKIPEGDMLIHAGDITNNGSVKVLGRFRDWILTQPHKYKVIIAGNHDWCFERPSEKAIARSYLKHDSLYYLQDSGVEIEGLKIWGSPWQPEFHAWAFNLPRGREIRQKWDLIPRDTNILVTHGPPYGYGDIVDRIVPGELENRVGCRDLRNAIREMPDLKLHVFGHIHEDPGVWKDEKSGVTYINATTCDLSYAPIHSARIIDI